MDALMGGAQGNSAAIQAQKAQEREATQLQPFYLDNIVHNNKQISFIRSISLALSGCAAGVLDLTSVWGLAFFALCVVLTNALILLLPCGSTPQKFLLNPPSQSPLGILFSTAASVATAAAIASPGIIAYGAAAMLGGAGNTANSWSKVKVQKVVGGEKGEDKHEVAWYLFEGLKSEVLSFVLWWTFWTAIVHVYE